MRGRARPVGVVLAGGEGRRLGGGKAVVELDGRPLLAYPLAALRAVLDEVAVVAKRSTALPPLDAAVAVWLEPDEPRHPLAGVVHALRAAGGRPVVVVAVDMPLVDADLVRRLATAPAPGGARAVVPRAGGRLQPLCARYEPGGLALLAGFAPGDRATDLAARLAPVVLDCADEELFLNVNAPADLPRAAALLRARAGRGGA